MKLFSYGTLQDLDVLDIVAGIESFERLGVAWLENHQARKLIGENYPVLVESKGHRLRGIIIESSSEFFWKRVDFFEQDYLKKEVTASLHDKDVECFVFSEEPGKDLSEDEWVFDVWHKKKQERKAYLDRCREFMDMFGKVERAKW